MRVIALALLLAAPAAATNYTLTVSTVGPNSTSVITSSNPATGINCGSSNTACSASFAAGAVVTLTQVADSTTVFAGWSGAQGCANNQPTCAVTMNAAAAVTATYLPVVSIALSGVGLGTVTDATGLVNCSSAGGCVGAGAQTYAYAQGVSVILTEVAGASSTFVGWTGNAGCGTASTCTFTLNGYNVIVATFTSGGPFTLAVSVPNGGGTVTSSPSGINCGATCAAAFTSGTSVTLTTAAAAGYRFVGWSNGGCSGTTLCVVNASSTYQSFGGANSPAAFFYKN